MRRLAWLLTVVAAAGAGAVPPASAHAWKLYGNRRYGYSVCYPADLFRPQAEPDSHDGVLFDGRRGATLSVSGEPASGTGLAEVMGALTGSLDGTVTYRAAKPGWMVASGTKGPDFFYARLVRTNTVIAQYVLVYPAAQQAAYAPVIARMNGCLKIG